MSDQQNSCENLELFNLDEVPISAEEYDQIISIQSNILGMIADGKSANLILDTLCSLAEKLLGNAIASIMLLDNSDGTISVIAAPSIPEVVHKALEKLRPGKGGGSCGNAIFQNKAQYIANTFEDDRWEELRQLAYDFNLCSCWSVPVRDQDSKPIATFALSSFEHRSPSNFHKKLLETGAKIVSIVLKNMQKDKQIDLFSLAMKNASEGIIITDEHNKIIEVNDTFTKIYKYSKEQVLGKNPSFLSSHKQTPAFYATMWATLEQDDKWAGEIVNVDAEGKEITQWLSISVLHSANNSKNYVGIFTDLTELKNAQNKIETMAFYDSLTSLPNKSNLLKTLNKSNTSVTLILLNINNFSYINSAYGYATGDQILIDIADVLSKNFETDAAFRINSDEFALLYKSKINIKEKVKEIQNYFFSSTLLASNLTFHISFTYGAIYADKHLLRNGAFALKKAKENGKNSLYIYEDGNQEHTQKEKEAFMDSNRLLYAALIEDRFVPYYQGIRNNKTGEILKYEVLARIQDFDKVIAPFAFLEAAKLSGLLIEITKSIVDKSFAYMCKNNYTFSINITEEDLNQHYLEELLSNKTKQYGIDPKRVILEVLEGISATGKSNHIDQLKALKSIGFKIALDDFGSEYSNFERILDLDIDFLKIDARYIKNIDKDPKSYEIAKAISFFAKNAKIPTIAEFVHSQEVQDKVNELGIEFSQGYLFSEPALKPLL
ncbi:MAG: EAL domain-containing protein [Campylobacterales bacterium]|nr:EAL domain-containing protein [Campylobacterales bacterium]